MTAFSESLMTTWHLLSGLAQKSCVDDDKEKQRGTELLELRRVKHDIFFNSLTTKGQSGNIITLATLNMF